MSCALRDKLLGALVGRGALDDDRTTRLRKSKQNIDAYLAAEVEEFTAVILGSSSPESITLTSESLVGQLKLGLEVARRLREILHRKSDPESATRIGADHAISSYEAHRLRNLSLLELLKALVKRCDNAESAQDVVDLDAQLDRTHQGLQLTIDRVNSAEAKSPLAAVIYGLAVLSSDLSVKASHRRELGLMLSDHEGKLRVAERLIANARNLIEHDQQCIWWFGYADQLSLQLQRAILALAICNGQLPREIKHNIAHRWDLEFEETMNRVADTLYLDSIRFARCLHLFCDCALFVFVLRSMESGDENFARKIESLRDSIGRHAERLETMLKDKRELERGHRSKCFANHLTEMYVARVLSSCDRTSKALSLAYSV